MIGKHFFAFLLMRKKILSEEGFEKRFTSTMKIPALPPDKKMVVALQHFKLIIHKTINMSESPV